MQTIDGDFDSVSRAALWTIDELIGFNDRYSLLHTVFAEGETFELYQDPLVGWITMDSLKLGKRAQKLIFRYCYDKDPVNVVLQTCEGTTPMSLTAVKTALLTSKILTECMSIDREYPCAQPMSWHESDFPIIGASINVESLKELRNNGKIKDLLRNLSPADAGSDFAIGLPYENQNLAESHKEFSPGDIVIIKRSRVSPTFGKVMDIKDKQMRIAVETNPDGSILSFKEINTEKSNYNILGHWATDDSDSEVRTAKKRRLNED